MTEPSRDDKQPSFMQGNPWVNILKRRGKEQNPTPQTPPHRNTRKTVQSSLSRVPSGGTPIATPIVLTYEPLADTKSMKRLLGDLTKWVLERKIHHRLASTCRGLIETFIELDEHERVDRLEERIVKLEARVR